MTANNTQVCRAYVETTNNQTGATGWCYKEVNGCTDDNCRDALNQAAFCAAYYASCDDNSECEVTYWRYECIDLSLQAAENHTSQAFKSLPEVNFGTKVPKQRKAA